MTSAQAWIALLLAALSASSAQGAPAPTLQARVRVFQAYSSQTDPETLAAALDQASALLTGSCGLGLSLTAITRLPLDSPWSRLPPGREARSRALKRLAAQAKAPDPGALALFVLPSSADERLSWALVDVSPQSACDSPQEARFLDRFGSLFLTDLSFDLPRDREAPPPGPAALLLAHELLHSLTQRGHPSHAPRGSVMADHWADMGPAIAQDWCDCARRSPYAQKLYTKPAER